MGAECNTEAYTGVELGQHNAAVGAAVYELFKDRILKSEVVARSLARAFPGLGPEALLLASVLAGSLHDIGKASPGYRRRAGEGRASYYGHEAAGAVLLRRAASRLLESKREKEALVLELAAWAVARHHSAMKGRHPADAAESFREAARFRKAARKALIGLAERPECLNVGIPGPLRGSRIGRALIEAAEDLAKSKPVHQKLDGILNKELQSLSKYPSRLKGRIQQGEWLAYSCIASGAVIVADILVAGWERRETDEGVMPSYAAWWRAELDQQAVERVKDLAGNREEAEKVLKNALHSTLFR